MTRKERKKEQETALEMKVEEDTEKFLSAWKKNEVELINIV